MSYTKLLKNSVELARKGKRATVTEPSDLPPGVKLDREGNFILPSQPARRADILYATVRLRLDLKHRVDKLKQLETQLSEFFINTLPVSKATGISGQVARVQINLNPTPVVHDWSKFFAYVRKNNAFDLLQHKFTKTAIQERLEAKVRLPGVSVFQAKKVSCTKL